MHITIKKQLIMALRKLAMPPVFCLAAFLCCSCGVPKTQEKEATVIQGKEPSAAETEDAFGVEEKTDAAKEAADGKENAKRTSMETVAILDYAVPQPVPNVLVNLEGYPAEGSKRAAVKGKQLPKTYSLVDAGTREVVFTGRLEDEEYNEETDSYTAYADFGEWTQEGSYYLECEYIGRSYPFKVENQFYGRLFGDICGKMYAECEAKTISIADVTELILCYEWYPDIFLDEDSNQIPDVLDKIAAWIAATAEETVEPGEEALYAAALAKFSYLYQKFDRQYATDCLKRSSVVYDRTQTTLQKDADCFYALTELYRATGLYTYSRQIEEYKTYFENHADFTKESGYLYGAMTYIATRQPVNVRLCEIFMSTIMAEGEEIGDVYEEMIHPVNARNNGAEDLLNHALDIACANYVMNNPQYNQVIEEFLHYLMGRNQQSIGFCGVNCDGNCESNISEEMDEGYLLLVAQLTAVQKFLGE